LKHATCDLGRKLSSHLRCRLIQATPAARSWLAPSESLGLSSLPPCSRRTSSQTCRWWPTCGALPAPSPVLATLSMWLCSSGSTDPWVATHWFVASVMAFCLSTRPSPFSATGPCASFPNQQAPLVNFKSSSEYSSLFARPGSLHTSVDVVPLSGSSHGFSSPLQRFSSECVHFALCSLRPAASSRPLLHSTSRLCLSRCVPPSPFWRPRRVAPLSPFL